MCRRHACKCDYRVSKAGMPIGGGNTCFRAPFFCISLLCSSVNAASAIGALAQAGQLSENSAGCVLRARTTGLKAWIYIYYFFKKFTQSTVDFESCKVIPPFRAGAGILGTLAPLPGPGSTVGFRLSGLHRISLNRVNRTVIFISLSWDLRHPLLDGSKQVGCVPVCAVDAVVPPRKHRRCTTSLRLCPSPAEHSR